MVWGVWVFSPFLSEEPAHFNPDLPLLFHPLLARCMVVPFNARKSICLFLTFISNESQIGLDFSMLSGYPVSNFLQLTSLSYEFTMFQAIFVEQSLVILFNFVVLGRLLLTVAGPKIAFCLIPNGHMLPFWESTPDFVLCVHLGPSSFDKRLPEGGNNDDGLKSTTTFRTE
jgi:hypothetical protein